MTADKWMKMQRNVSMVSCAMLASFWLAFSLPDLWWFGLLMLAYQGQNFWESMKADMADERAELIAARAAFLSQKLMMGAGVLLFGFERKHPLSGSGPLIAILLVGMCSEEIFRKMLGAEPRRIGGPTRVLAVVAAIVTVALACGLGYVFWKL